VTSPEREIFTTCETPGTATALRLSESWSKRAARGLLRKIGGGFAVLRSEPRHENERLDITAWSAASLMTDPP